MLLEHLGDIFVVNLLIFVVIIKCYSIKRLFTKMILIINRQLYICFVISDLISYARGEILNLKQTFFMFFSWNNIRGGSNLKTNHRILIGNDQRFLTGCRWMKFNILSMLNNKIDLLTMDFSRSYRFKYELILLKSINLLERIKTSIFL